MEPVRQIIGGLGNLMFKQACLYSQMRNGVIPDLYVQSEAYFKKYASEIKQMYGTGIGQNGMVSLHIRRGDYFDKGEFYVDLTKGNYYQKAVAFFPNDKFLVFCRDRQGRDESDQAWVMEFVTSLVGDRFVFHEGKSETEDLNDMASCSSNIMANSTFSWWAAYLNPNINKKVICPKQWFGDNIQRCEPLEEWIKI